MGNSMTSLKRRRTTDPSLPFKYNEPQPKPALLLLHPLRGSAGIPLHRESVEVTGSEMVGTQQVIQDEKSGS